LIELEELKVNTSLRTQPNQKAFPFGILVVLTSPLTWKSVSTFVEAKHEHLRRT
jgi:hypothetical protein